MIFSKYLNIKYYNFVPYGTTHITSNHEKIYKENNKICLQYIKYFKKGKLIGN